MNEKHRADSKAMYIKTNFGDFDYDRTRFNHHLFDLLSRVDNKPKRQLFDIGCGTGYWFPHYQAMGFKKEYITGCDQSASALRMPHAQGYRVVEGDALKLPFADGVSQFTICNGVIHHTVDSVAAFDELCRITSPGGELLVSVYNIWNPYFLLMHKLTWPLRYCYWNVSKAILIPVFLIFFLLIQPLSLLLFQEFRKPRDVEKLLMDQMFTPVAELFSRRKLKRYAERNGLIPLEEGYFALFMMFYIRFSKPLGDSAPLQPHSKPK